MKTEYFILYNGANLINTKIFDTFYKPMLTNRAGGGMPKKKMRRITPTYKQMLCMELKIKTNNWLLAYYTKLKKSRSQNRTTKTNMNNCSIYNYSIIFIFF
jgi:hypothetical protein